MQQYGEADWLDVVRIAPQRGRAAQGIVGDRIGRQGDLHSALAGPERRVDAPFFFAGALRFVEQRPLDVVLSLASKYKPATSSASLVGGTFGNLTTLIR